MVGESSSGTVAMKGNYISQLSTIDDKMTILWHVLTLVGTDDMSLLKIIIVISPIAA